MRFAPRLSTAATAAAALALAVLLLTGYFPLRILAGDKPASPPCLNGLDPVLLTGGKEVAGDKAISLTHEGHRYLFVSAENRERFQGEPSRFGIQLGGQCALMPNAKGDPALFAVHKARIYLFGSAACKAAFTAEPEKYLKARKNVAIFVHEGVELLDFAGPAEVFASAGSPRAYQVYTVAAKEGDIVSQGFLTVKPRYTIANCPKPDLIVLPGGATRVPLADPAVIEWIKKSSADAEVVLSVCTGAFLLAKAGLLDGKEATTHWGAIPALTRAAPKVKVLSDRRYVDNGKVVTSAGVSAGIDAALHVVDRQLGRKAAQETARYMEYRWVPGAGKEEK